MLTIKQFPIPLDELKEMRGQSVFIVPFKGKIKMPPELLQPRKGYVDIEKPFVTGNKLTFWFEDYGKAWVAYRTN